MSSPEATRPPPTDAPPPVGAVLRHYGPWLAGFAAVALLVAAYAHLSSRVSALEAVVGRGSSSPTSAPSEAITTGDVAPAAPAVVSHAPPPRWECSGVIAQDLVRQAIGRHGSAVMRCFEQRRQAAPDLRGTLVLRLRVAESGAVDSVHVAGIQDDELVRCVGNDALRWHFAPPANGRCAVVEAPFALGP